MLVEDHMVTSSLTDVEQSGTVDSPCVARQRSCKYCTLVREELARVRGFLRGDEDVVKGVVEPSGEVGEKLINGVVSASAHGVAHDWTA